LNQGADPAILLIAEGDAADARTAVAAAGGRIAGEIGQAEAMARLERPDALAGLLLMLDGHAEPRLLRRIEALARADMLGAVIAMPPALIDAVMAEIADPRIELLCAPAAIELAAAISLMQIRHAAGSDGLAGREAARVRRLGDEVGRIAQALARLAEEAGGGRGAGAAPMPGSGGAGTPPAQHGNGGNGGKALDAAYIRRIIRARRLRDRYFDPALFADPAWDMLLDLMAARLEGRRVAVSSLCIAAAVPTTTGLRWIRALGDRGIFVRSADPKDGRRMFVDLSDQAAEAMTDYFGGARKLGLLNL